MDIQEYRMQSPSGKCKFVSNTATDKRYTIVSGTSLEGIGKTFLKSATRITFSGGEFYNLLGLVLVKDLPPGGVLYNVLSFDTKCSFVAALEVVSKFAGTEDVLGCQEALIEAGLKQYAKL